MNKLSFSVETIFNHFIKPKIKEFQRSKKINLKNIIINNRVKGHELETPGCYVIYEYGKTRPIYIGSAGKGKHYLKYRIGDLFSYSQKSKDPFYHTLTKKLIMPNKIGRYKDIEELQEFYKEKCYLKIIETKTVREARILEDILIEILKPQYND